MRLEDLLWYFPIGVATALAVGASGRHTPRDVLRGSLRAFGTLTAVVAGVGLAIRLLVVLIV
jgi:hypothetical protein